MKSLLSCFPYVSDYWTGFHNRMLFSTCTHAITIITHSAPSSFQVAKLGPDIVRFTVPASSSMLNNNAMLARIVE